MNSTLIPFAFGDHLVRIVMIDGAPCWILKDIAEAIGHTNHKVAWSRLPADEKGVTVCYPLGAGGPQEHHYVTEPGLYRLIFRSNLPSAEDFRRFVFHEVLPAIRKTGRYEAPSLARELDPAPHEIFISLLREQIALGVAPNVAARYAAKLSPAAAPQMRIPAAVPGSVLAKGSSMTAADELIASMEENRRYNVDELLPLLPAHHPIHQRKEGRGRQSALGRLLTAYVQAGHIHRELGTDHRSVFVRLPSVVSFSAEP